MARGARRFQPLQDGPKLSDPRREGIAISGDGGSQDGGERGLVVVGEFEVRHRRR